MYKKARLICIPGKDKASNVNHKKYYNMNQIDDEFFIAEWGIIGGKPNFRKYLLKDWNKIYTRKTRNFRNGYIYQDVTISEIIHEPANNIISIEDKKIAEFIDRIILYAKDSVENNYNITSINEITQLQINMAQHIIHNIAFRTMNNIPISKSEFNIELSKLFEVIPRNIKNIDDFFLTNNIKTQIINIITKEQDTLDSLTSYIKLLKDIKKITRPQTILDILDISIHNVTEEDLFFIKCKLNDLNHRYKNAFKVVCNHTQKAFDDFWIRNLDQQEFVKKKNTLWYGSRNETWLSILQNGLTTRSQRIDRAGITFGEGIYLTPNSTKSIDLSSLNKLYYPFDKNNTGIISIFDVNIGRELEVRKHYQWHSKLNKEFLHKKGKYDSLYIKTKNAPLDNEVVVYDTNQCTIKYMVEIK
jgi:poly [ADP-ribose] polymerase 2/3/4